MTDPEFRRYAPVFLSDWSKVMPAFDLPLEQLHEYKPKREEPADFQEFWAKSLQEVNLLKLEVTLEQVDHGLKTFETFDITYSGWGGHPIRAWLILPKGTEIGLPCVIEYPSYGGGRGFPLDWLAFPAAGFATFIMDNRGQGSGWRHGETDDPEPLGIQPHSPGVMTLGILDPARYYYRRLFMDGVRACQVVKQLERVDPSKIAVTGMSQGAAVSLAAATLEPGLAAVMPDMTFLSHFRRATQLVDTPPYNEINNYCQIHRDQVERVFTTLSYFDAQNFAEKCKIPALFSVGLMDMIAPPSTVFAAYNWYSGPKQMKVWSYNGHEGGGSFQTMEKIKFLHSLFAH
jgi:cephalosporin-C deacetylase